MQAGITVHPFQIWVGACTAVARSRDTSSDRRRIEGIRNELRPYDMDRFKRAADDAGTTQRVCGPLAGSGNSNDDVFLNLGCHFPDAERFLIVLWDIGGLEPVPYGATLSTAGPVTLDEGVVQIELRSASLVEIYESASVGSPQWREIPHHGAQRLVSARLALLEAGATG